MFKFNELKQIHLEITNNCQADCPMCSRNVHGGLENPLLKINSWTLEMFQSIMTKEVLNQIDNYYFCGGYGDPIVNNDLIKMCLYSRDINLSLGVSIHTNGGARNSKWWQSLAQAMPTNHSVVFALDGLADTHHLYRVGTQFDTVLRNAQTFINAGGIAEWVFIRFKHNEHQVDEARALADKLGFKKFTLKNSSRFMLDPKFSVVDKQGNHLYNLEPATDTPIKFIDRKIVDSYKELLKDTVIDCHSLKTKEVYIDAFGDLYPCCWLGGVPYTYIDPDHAYEVRTEMLRQNNELVEKLGNINTVTSSIKEIINSDAYQTVWEDYWTNNKLITCARSCGQTSAKFSRPIDQIQG